MNESGFIKSIHTKLRQIAPDIWAWKINDSYNNEKPDCVYHGQGAHTLWVEYKFRKTLPVRDTTLIVPDLSAKQRFWLDQRHERGLLCVAVVGSPHGHAIYRSPMEWTQGLVLASFKSRSLKTPELAHWIKRVLQEGTLLDEHKPQDHEH